MTWRVDYSREAQKLIEKHEVHQAIREAIQNLLSVISVGISVANVKKLEGDWEGYYRLRKGRLRIIFDLDPLDKVLHVERVDFRGNVYK